MFLSFKATKLSSCICQKLFIFSVARLTTFVMSFVSLVLKYFSLSSDQRKSFLLGL